MPKNRLVVPAGQLRKIGDLTHGMEVQILKATKLAKELSHADSASGQHLKSCLQQTQNIAKAIRAESTCLMDYLSLNGMGRIIKQTEWEESSSLAKRTGIPKGPPLTISIGSGYPPCASDIKFS